MNYSIFNIKKLNEIAKNYATPCYIYEKKLLLDTLNLVKENCFKYFKNNIYLHYALKANDNQEILSLILNNGFGIDCVSGGEIKLAIDLGCDPQKIVFAGVGKQDNEIEMALINNIYCFNCESEEEIRVINSIANKLKLKAKIMIRVNPNIESNTHKNITTGSFNNKFGIPFYQLCSFLEDLKQLSNINLIGLHYHIGSQICDLTVFKNLVEIINTHVEHLNSLNIPITDLNFGGGLGIDYENPQDYCFADFDGYFKTFHRNFNRNKDIKIHFELGRSLVAQCGIIMSKVIFIKNIENTNYAIIDAGMNDLIRPALYDSLHKIINLSTSVNFKKYNIVGPVCESTDIFVKNLLLPELQRNDIVIIYSCGAYGHVLAGTYNRRTLIKEYTI